MDEDYIKSHNLYDGMHVPLDWVNRRGASAEYLLCLGQALCLFVGSVMHEA